MTDQTYEADDGTTVDIPDGWVQIDSLDSDEPAFLDEAGNQWSLADLLSRQGSDKPESAIVPHQAYQPAHTTVPAPVHTWLDSDPESLQMALKIRKTNRDNLMQWVRDALIEGTDFGRIHVMPKNKCAKGNNCTNQYHYSKPCLWKAGAEKVVGMLGLRAEWPDLADARQQAMQPSCTSVILRCHLVNPDGVIVSEGIGGRGMNDDYGQINKVFKMAKKSSLIDAVLNACGLSEVFTQDIVDDDRKETIYETTLDEDGVRYLNTIAAEMFGEKSKAVINSLCRRRFGIDTGDPSLIPAYRLQDAIRALEKKAASEGDTK